MKLFLILLTLVSTQAWAAACCGGGFAAPSLLAGDDKAQLAASFSVQQIQTDVDDQGFWRAHPDREQTRALRLEGAHLLSDRWQVGGSIPMIERTRQGQSRSGSGDLTANLGYEVLPDWDYNLWRPKGLLFAQITAPTGETIYQSQDSDQLSARGRGFWALGVGTLLVKAWESWDSFMSLDFHRSLARSFSSTETKGKLFPGWGGNLNFGVGYNLADWRFGTALQWTYEDPVEVSTPEISSRGAAQRFATASLSASYIYRGIWAGTLSYSDQGLFGSPHNTTLARGVMLTIQRRWSR